MITVPSNIHISHPSLRIVHPLYLQCFVASIANPIEQTLDECIRYLTLHMYLLVSIVSIYLLQCVFIMQCKVSSYKHVHSCLFCWSESRRPMYAHHFKTAVSEYDAASSKSLRKYTPSMEYFSKKYMIDEEQFSRYVAIDKRFRPSIPQYNPNPVRRPRKKHNTAPVFHHPTTSNGCWRCNPHTRKPRQINPMAHYSKIPSCVNSKFFSSACWPI